MSRQTGAEKVSGFFFFSFQLTVLKTDFTPLWAPPSWHKPHSEVKNSAAPADKLALFGKCHPTQNPVQTVKIWWFCFQGSSWVVQRETSKCQFFFCPTHSEFYQASTVDTNRPIIHEYIQTPQPAVSCFLTCLTCSSFHVSLTVCSHSWDVNTPPPPPLYSVVFIRFVLFSGGIENGNRLWFSTILKMLPHWVSSSSSVILAGRRLMNASSLATWDSSWSEMMKRYFYCCQGFSLLLHMS